VQEWSLHDDSVWAVQGSDNLDFVYTGGRDGRVCSPFWLCLSINVGNKWGWSCSAVRLWDLGQQACVLKWSLHDKSVWAVHGSDNLMSCV
jgi:hypothetical protein